MAEVNETVDHTDDLSKIEHVSVSSEMESKTASALADAFGEESDVETPAETEVETPATTETDPPAETETPAETPVETEPTEKTEAATEPKPGTVPTLPASYRRSLLGMEWTNEEIDAALKDGGQAFLATAGKLHATRTSEVQRWAEEGRRAKAAEAETAKQNPAPQAAELKPLDAKALKAKYGDDGMVDEIVGPVNAMIQQINAILPQVQQQRQATQQAEVQALSNQIDQFFGNEQMKPYADMYGNGSSTLTPDNIQSRNKVLETADALVAGARMQGRNLTLQDALTLAHDAVAGPTKEKAAVAKVKAAVTTRAKGITLKPVTQAAPTTAGKVPTRNQLESKIKAKLAAAFG